MALPVSPSAPCAGWTSVGVVRSLYVSLYVFILYMCLYMSLYVSLYVFICAGHQWVWYVLASFRPWRALRPESWQSVML
jgi:hypothetical protein